MSCFVLCQRPPKRRLCSCVGISMATSTGFKFDGYEAVHGGFGYDEYNPEGV